MEKSRKGRHHGNQSKGTVMGPETGRLILAQNVSSLLHIESMGISVSNYLKSSETYTTRKMGSSTVHFYWKKKKKRKQERFQSRDEGALGHSG